MLAAQVLSEPGDQILFEDPGPFIARNLFLSLGRRLLGVPVDAEGWISRLRWSLIPMRAWPSSCPRASIRWAGRCPRHAGRAAGLGRGKRRLDRRGRLRQRVPLCWRPLPSMHSVDRAGG